MEKASSGEAHAGTGQGTEGQAQADPGVSASGASAMIEAFIRKRLDYFRRKEIAGGVVAPAPQGPMVILWTIDKDDQEKGRPGDWEILPEWLALLVLNELPYQGVARAIVYRRLPAHAPDDVANEWYRR